MSQTTRPRRGGASSWRSLSEPDRRSVAPSRHRETTGVTRPSTAGAEPATDDLDDVISAFYASVAAGARWTVALQRAFDAITAEMGLRSIVLSLFSERDGATRHAGADTPRRGLARHDRGIETAVLRVTLQRRQLGAIVAERASTIPFTPAERAVLERLAMGLSLALHASSLHEQGVWLARCRERQAIANALHDDLAPILFSARCALESVLDARDAAGAGELLTYARDLVVRGESAVREVMKSSDDCAGNFTFELAELLRALEDRFRIPIAFDVDPSAEGEGLQLGEGASRALLRAAKEGVSNAVTHAAPALITVSLEASRGWLHLQVADDGCDRRVSRAGGHGLRSVRKELWRLGGELKLAVDEAAGAILSVRLPVA